MTTLTMAFSLVLAGSASEVFGRKRIMIASLAASALATLLCRLAPNLAALVALRALAGLALSGLPAVAMAYLADEIAPESLGLAMGLYIAGSTLGGMSGRLIVGLLADHLQLARRGRLRSASRASLARLYFLFALPRERAFEPKPFDFRALMRMALRHFADPGLRLLFAEGFLVMGAFVCTYNYIAFRLAAQPFELSATTRPRLSHLCLRRCELDGHGRPRRALRPAAHVMDRIRHRRRRRCRELARLARPARCSALALVTWGFFGAHSVVVELGGLARDERAGAGGGALSVLLLSRLQRRGFGGRLVLFRLAAGMA